MLRTRDTVGVTLTARQRTALKAASRTHHEFDEENAVELETEVRTCLRCGDVVDFTTKRSAQAAYGGCLPVLTLDLLLEMAEARGELQQALTALAATNGEPIDRLFNHVRGRL